MNTPENDSLHDTARTLGKRADSADIRTVGIIGAGTMGRQIAAANVNAGLSIILCDQDSAAANGAVHQILEGVRKPPCRAPHFADSAESTPIVAVDSDEELAAADLIIETVSEVAATKTSLYSRIEPHLRNDTIVASNSSSIPISQLASGWKTPGRFCGLHFCYPINERPLVEVVGADATTPETLERIQSYARSIGMNPIEVRDRPGFLLNRILVPYMNEALELLLEGADAELLDHVALEFGMPCGPLRHYDEFGIDVALAVGRLLFWTFPERIVPSELLIAMYKSKRLGRKAGGGFYADGSSTLDPQVVEMIHERKQNPTSQFTREQVTRRLFLPMFLEATRAVEESVVQHPAIVDIALRDGLGLTGSGRGIFAWANSIGAATLLEWLQPLRQLGQRFEPTQFLLDWAAGRCSLEC